MRRGTGFYLRALLLPFAAAQTATIEWTSKRHRARRTPSRLNRQKALQIVSSSKDVDVVIPPKSVPEERLPSGCTRPRRDRGTLGENTASFERLLTNEPHI